MISTGHETPAPPFLFRACSCRSRRRLAPQHPALHRGRRVLAAFRRQWRQGLPHAEFRPRGSRGRELHPRVLLLDYYFEIERFDRDLGAMLKLLEDTGQLDNTLIVVTSDNGFPFPRGKATCYDAGTRMPLAIRWPARVKAARVVDDFISLTDLAPTFLEAAGLKPLPEMTGRSLVPLLTSGKSGQVDPM